MRAAAKHTIIAILFLVAQLLASASISEHASDYHHSAHDCAICTTIIADGDDGLPATRTESVPSPARHQPDLCKRALPAQRPLTTQYLARAPPLF